MANKVGNSKNAKIVDRAGSFAVVDCGVGKYAVSMASGLSTTSFSQFVGFGSQNWESDPIAVGGVRCVPWGPTNDMPELVRNILEKNNLGPGVLSRKMGLLYGQGPMLYRNEIVDNEVQRIWMVDADIQNWLDSWDYKKYIRDVLSEFVHLNGHFTKYISGKSVRRGKAYINRLECLPSGDCLLVWPDKDYPTSDDINQVLVGDMKYYKDLRLFPVFDKWKPAKHEAAVKYHNLRSFGRNLYSVSSFFGSIPWMIDSNDIAEIVRVLNDNLIAAAYIVHEPAGYWDRKKQDLMEDHPEWELAHINKKMEELRDEIIKKLAEVMSGKENAGKFFTCVDFIDEMGHMQSWKIEPIEMNLDKYIAAQKDIARLADSATTSGFGLSPALANIIIDGKSDSGSQMLYALKIFYGADTQIAEEIALEGINDAIRINFPQKKGVFLGLYRKVIQKEDNVSAEDRAINQA